MALLRQQYFNEGLSINKIWLLLFWRNTEPLQRFKTFGTSEIREETLANDAFYAWVPHT